MDKYLSFFYVILFYNNNTCRTIILSLNFHIILLVFKHPMLEIEIAVVILYYFIYTSCVKNKNNIVVNELFHLNLVCLMLIILYYWPNEQIIFILFFV